MRIVQSDWDAVTTDGCKMKIKAADRSREQFRIRSAVGPEPPNSSMQLTALRAAADAERSSR